MQLNWLDERRFCIHLRLANVPTRGAGRRPEGPPFICMPAWLAVLNKLGDLGIIVRARACTVCMPANNNVQDVTQCL